MFGIPNIDIDHNHANKKKNALSDIRETIEAILKVSPNAAEWLTDVESVTKKANEMNSEKTSSTSSIAECVYASNLNILIKDKIDVFGLSIDEVNALFNQFRERER